MHTIVDLLTYCKKEGIGIDFSRSSVGIGYVLTAHKIIKDDIYKVTYHFYDSTPDIERQIEEFLYKAVLDFYNIEENLVDDECMEDEE